MKRGKRQRPRVIETLGDLLNGDIVSIHTKHGEIVVQRSFGIGDDVFLRIRDSDAKDFIKFPQEYPIKEVIRLQPTALAASASGAESDPLLSRT